MFRKIYHTVNNLREILLVIFLLTLAYRHLSPDSQHGIQDAIYEFTENGHLIASAVWLTLFLAALGMATLRHRKKIAGVLGLIWREASRIFAGEPKN